MSVYDLSCPRLKFVLFAAALPILAYWHYSGADKSEEIQQEDAQDEAQTVSALHQSSSC